MITWFICADLTAWTVEWSRRRCERWPEAQAKAQPDKGKGESPRIGVHRFLAWLA
jgi:hypothetical protein